MRVRNVTAGTFLPSMGFSCASVWREQPWEQFTLESCLAIAQNRLQCSKNCHAQVSHAQKETLGPQG
jgi:hypothetical protein